MLDGAAIDELFEVLMRYVRIRDRAIHTTLKTADGEIETAAIRGLFNLDRKAMRSGELAEVLNFDPSTVSRHVGRLVEMGLVRREADPADGRATILVITDTGKERVAGMRAIRREAMRKVMTDWDDDELHTLVALLSRFVDGADLALLRPQDTDCDPQDDHGCAPAESSGETEAR